MPHFDLSTEPAIVPGLAPEQWILVQNNSEETAFIENAVSAPSADSDDALRLAPAATAEILRKTGREVYAWVESGTGVLTIPD